MKEQLREAVELARQGAAVTIQQSIRCRWAREEYEAKKEVKETKEAACLVLQRFWLKKRKAWQIAHEIRNSQKGLILAKKQRKAALVVQRYWRGHTQHFVSNFDLTVTSLCVGFIYKCITLCVCVSNISFFDTVGACDVGAVRYSDTVPLAWIWSETGLLELEAIVRHEAAVVLAGAGGQAAVAGLIGQSDGSEARTSSTTELLLVVEVLGEREAGAVLPEHRGWQ